MALDQIWKQQLTLVTYGNEFLSQNLSFHRWVQHSIFNRHILRFRDLNSQHLLAQHFQIWLEGLKKQGATRLSLHSSALLNEERNPNSNVELLPITHFIVSHETNKKTAWIFGKELPEWYTADNDYEAPSLQQETFRLETFWRFEMNSKLAKRIDSDLLAPNWDDIQHYTENELFDTRYAQGMPQPTQLDLPYYGMSQPVTDFSEDTSSVDSKYLSLLPTDYQADFAHQTLHRLDALSAHIQQQIQHPYNAEGEALKPDEQLNLRHFSQKLDDLTGKFITKAANHYKTAQLTKVEAPSPFDPETKGSKSRHTAFASQHPKSPKTGVFALIVVTVLICLAAYYFGL